MTYVVTGLSRPVAIVGDSLFAGSMGGGNVSYDDALRNNREKILTLPDETIVCPGHGPLTTVGKEKRDNPFFANASVGRDSVEPRTVGGSAERRPTKNKNQT